MREAYDLRDVQVQAYMDAVENGKNVIYLISDSLSTSKLAPFARKYPERVVNVGIAEMNLIGMAAGLSEMGYIAVTGNASSFLVSRSNEQLKDDISYSHSNVKINAMHPGFCYGQDGVTHHSTYDLATVLGFPDIEIYYPCDGRETRQVIEYGIEHTGPVFTALGSGKFMDITPADYRFTPGQPIKLSQGDSVTIIALGVAVHDVLDADIDGADVFAVSSIRPLDYTEILKSIARTGRAVTVEHHNVHGGLGSLISESITDNGLGVPLLRLGVPFNSFTKNISSSAIKAGLGLDAAGIRKAVSEFLR